MRASGGLNELIDFRFYPVGTFSDVSACPPVGSDKGCEMDMLESCIVQHSCPTGTPCKVDTQLALINFLACFEGGKKAAGLAVARSCAATAGLDIAGGVACYGDAAQKAAAFAAITAAAKATGETPYKCFPWVAVNGTLVSDPKVDSCLAHDFDLTQSICAAIEGPKPAVCT